MITVTRTVSTVAGIEGPRPGVQDHGAVAPGVSVDLAAGPRTGGGGHAGAGIVEAPGRCRFRHVRAPPSPAPRIGRPPPRAEDRAMRPCHRVCDAVAHGVDSVVSLGFGHTTVSLYVALVALALNLAVTTVRTLLLDRVGVPRGPDHRSGPPRRLRRQWRHRRPPRPEHLSVRVTLNLEASSPPQDSVQADASSAVTASATASLTCASAGVGRPDSTASCAKEVIWVPGRAQAVNDV